MKGKIKLYSNHSMSVIFKTLIKMFLIVMLFATYKFVHALMTSKSYRILLSEQTSIGIGALKTGGFFNMLGSTGQFTISSSQGSRYKINWGLLNTLEAAQLNLNFAHAKPNPCDVRKNCTGVIFKKLTTKATIKIYTISGEHIKTINKNNWSDESEQWQLKTEYGKPVASGLYLYLIESENSKKSGKLLIIR